MIEANCWMEICPHCGVKYNGDCGHSCKGISRFIFEPMKPEPSMGIIKPPVVPYKKTVKKYKTRKKRK